MTQQELEREARRILEGFPGQVVDSRLVDRMAFALSAAREEGFKEGVEAAAKVGHEFVNNCDADHYRGGDHCNGLNAYDFKTQKEIEVDLEEAILALRRQVKG